jgi:spoIIIJ-associated protein
VSERAPTLEELEEQGDAVADFLEELLEAMGVDAIAEPVRRGTHVYVDVVDAPEEDLSLLIGRQGQTLDAIQELTRMIVGHRLDQRIRVIVDVDGYRQRREDQLSVRGRDLAEQVQADGGEIELEPMSPFERKIVHDAVAEVDGVESLSRGEDPQRYVVIRRL